MPPNRKRFTEQSSDGAPPAKKINTRRNAGSTAEVGSAAESKTVSGGNANDNSPSSTNVPHGSILSNNRTNEETRREYPSASNSSGRDSSSIIRQMEPVLSLRDTPLPRHLSNAPTHSQPTSMLSAYPPTPPRPFGRDAFAPEYPKQELPSWIKEQSSYYNLPGVAGPLKNSSSSQPSKAAKKKGTSKVIDTTINARPSQSEWHRAVPSFEAKTMDSDRAARTSTGAKPTRQTCPSSSNLSSEATGPRFGEYQAAEALNRMSLSGNNSGRTQNLPSPTGPRTHPMTGQTMTEPVPITGTPPITTTQTEAVTLASPSSQLIAAPSVPTQSAETSRPGLIVPAASASQTVRETAFFNTNAGTTSSSLPTPAAPAAQQRQRKSQSSKPKPRPQVPQEPEFNPGPLKAEGIKLIGRWKDNVNKGNLTASGWQSQTSLNAISGREVVLRNATLQSSIQKSHTGDNTEPSEGFCDDGETIDREDEIDMYELFGSDPEDGETIDNDENIDMYELFGSDPEDGETIDSDENIDMYELFGSEPEDELDEDVPYADEPAGSQQEMSVRRISGSVSSMEDETAGRNVRSTLASPPSNDHDIDTRSVLGGSSAGPSERSSFRPGPVTSQSTQSGRRGVNNRSQQIARPSAAGGRVGINTPASRSSNDTIFGAARNLARILKNKTPEKNNSFPSQRK